MSSVKRVISGSAAAWSSIIVAVLSQIVLVPVYLGHWDPAQYGVWLAIAAFVSLAQLIDAGHQQFLGYEFLKYGTDSTEGLRTVLWSSIPFAVGTGLLQSAIIWCLVHLKLIHALFGKGEGLSNKMLDDASTVVVLSVFTFGIFGSVGGILVRVLAPLGYYPRMAWWGVMTGVVTASCTAVAVVLGANILAAGVVQTLAAALCSTALYFYVWRILLRSNLGFQAPNYRLGAKNLVYSQVLTITSLLAMARQHGARLVLAPLAGAGGLAAFSTMRTGANVALQGLSTITNPLLPELMRFLRERDQARSEAAFASVWIILLGVMAPAVVILQTIIQPMFLIWTRGKIAFDPLLFAMLSLSVLVYALAQPSITIVTGNNCLTPQLILSTVSALIAVCGMLALTPKFGLRGAGAALLAAEVISTTGYRLVARKWLAQNGMMWPKTSATIAAASVWIVALSLFCIVLFPSAKWLSLAFTLVFLAMNLLRYWRSLPLFATTRAKAMIISLPGLRSILAS